MCDLMGHGLGNEGFMVFGKKLHIVTHHRFFPFLESYHAGGFAPKIEAYLNLWHGVTEMALGLLQQCQCPVCHRREVLPLGQGAGGAHLRQAGPVRQFRRAFKVIGVWYIQR